jgi:hypothetical protein
LSKRGGQIGDTARVAMQRGCASCKKTLSCGLRAVGEEVTPHVYAAAAVPPSARTPAEASGSRPSSQEPACFTSGLLPRRGMSPSTSASPLPTQSSSSHPLEARPPQPYTYPSAPCAASRALPLLSPRLVPHQSRVILVRRTPTSTSYPRGIRPMYALAFTVCGPGRHIGFIELRHVWSWRGSRTNTAGVAPRCPRQSFADFFGQHDPDPASRAARAHTEGTVGRISGVGGLEALAMQGSWRPLVLTAPTSLHPERSTVPPA